MFSSGRGDRVRDMNSDEGDGFNEAIVPADYNGKESSLITDDIIFADVSVDPRLSKLVRNESIVSWQNTLDESSTSLQSAHPKQPRLDLITAH